MQKRCLDTSSGKAFLTTIIKGLSERWGTLIETISEKDPVLLAASLGPRYRKLKFMEAEDDARVQGEVQVLSIREAKESSSAQSVADSPKQQKTRNVQAQKSAVDDLLHSDTDSHTENS